jgi:hypothetical protein
LFWDQTNADGIRTIKSTDCPYNKPKGNSHGKIYRTKKPALKADFSIYKKIVRISKKHIAEQKILERCYGNEFDIKQKAPPKGRVHAKVGMARL